VINENNFIFEEEGVKITANVQKSAVNKYYRWELDHYFIIESDLGPGLTFQEKEGLENEELRYCFVKDYPFQDVHLLRDIANEADVGQTYQIDLEFISIDNKFEYEFVVESKLLALPERDYTFWSNVQSLADNTGSLFDAAPFEVIGNIREITGSAEEVAGLGFFGVYNAKIDREFINPQDIGISDPNVFPVCEVPASPGPPRPHPCQDCRLYEYLRNYENNPPDWWQY